MTLGQHLARQRLLSGSRVGEVAALLGVHRTTVYRWETDSTRPSTEQLAALVSAYSMDDRARSRTADLYAWGE